MKPLRIEVINFGAIAHAVVNLSGTTCAAIAGPNGAGKSTAFTVAPMFALFGSTKSGTSADDMVRCGSTEAAVTFDFDHQGDTWRVIRTRSTKGRGKSTLELQRLSGDNWTSTSGASIGETQKKIIDLLNLDAETFAASSMILQGDAGNFTSRPAGQRKAILAQILQLDQYEVLQDRARAKAQQCTVDMAAMQKGVETIDVRLAGKPELEADKFAVELQLVGLAKGIKTHEAAVQTAMVEHSSLVAKINAADEVGKRAKERWSEAGAKATERDQTESRVKSAKELLEQEEEIMARSCEHAEKTISVTVLRTKREQQQEILKEGTQLKADLDGIESSLLKTKPEIERIQLNLQERPELERQAVEHEKAVAALAEAQKRSEQYRAVNEKLTIAKNLLALTKISIVSETSLMQREIAELESKTAMIENAQCVDIERAQCVFLSDAKAAQAMLPVKRQKLEAYTKEQDKLVAEQQGVVDTLAQELTEINFSSADQEYWKEQIDDLKPKVELLNHLSGMTELLANLQVQEHDLLIRKEQVSSQREEKLRQYNEITAGLKDLPATEARLKELEPYLALKEKLPAAKEAVSSAKETIERLNREFLELSEQARVLDEEYTAIIGDAAGLEETARQKLTDAQQALEKTRNEHTVAVTRLGGIQAKLEALAADEIERTQVMEKLEPLAKQLTRWLTLVKAFGRDGIQALILENAVPELERIANDILGQMSGGRNFLRFETQKELKSRSGMAETLDIIVGDWAGERIYETYSGGEQLRIDFAIRFALAEMLAHRAGSKVDWLTIDEGFGSQSDEFLPLVIDAVQKVASRFGMVLVISHVKAVQEAFEERIDFLPAREDGAATEVKVA